MRYKRWTDDEIVRLTGMFWRGMTNREIAEKFGCSIRRIKDALSRYAITNAELGAQRRADRLFVRTPKKYKKPEPMPKMNCPTKEPRAADLDFMDAVEKGVCLWMDGKLKCCGAPRNQVSHRYCQHHFERSLKKHECDERN